MMSQSMRNITYVTNADMIWGQMIGKFLIMGMFVTEVTAVFRYK